jgi:hypothetical protein
LRRGRLIEKMTLLELATLIRSIEKHGEIEVYYDVSFTGEGRIVVQIFGNKMRPSPVKNVLPF